jgi:hypothetical protein
MEMLEGEPVDECEVVWKLGQKLSKPAVGPDGLTEEGGEGGLFVRNKDRKDHTRSGRGMNARN